MTPATAPQAERLGQAIRFRTVTVRSGVESADPAHDVFRSLNLHLRQSFPRVARDLEWTETPDGALLLSWSPASPGPELPVLFAVHSDVVPAGDEAKWTHGPFSGDVAGGFVWGRGCLDDKGMLLALFESLEDLLGRGMAPRRTVYVGVGCDEETEGRRGAAEIARVLAGRGARLAAVLDEGSLIVQGLLPSIPVSVAPVGIAEKGYADLSITVTGHGGHSSMPARNTAAGVLAAAVAGLEASPAPLVLTPVVRRFLADLGRVTPGAQGLALRGIRVLWPLLRGVLARDSTLAALLRTTRAVTVLRAGEAANVIPDVAQAVVNIRVLPGDSVPQAMEAVRRCVNRGLPEGFGLEVGLSGHSRACEPIAPCPSSGPIWDAVRSALESVAPGVVVTPFLTPGLTDSRAYAALTESIYRVLPVLATRQDLGLIHGVDERISLENYGRMIGYYTGLLSALAVTPRGSSGAP